MFSKKKQAHGVAVWISASLDAPVLVGRLFRLDSKVKYMGKTPKKTLLLLTVAAALSFTWIDGAIAQTGQERGSRRGTQKDVPAPTPARYPDAERKSPEAVAKRHGTKLEKLVEAYNAQNTAETLAIADQVIGNAKANAYERAFAARLAGASQLNLDNAKALAYLRQAVESDALGNDDHFDTMFLLGQLQVQQGQLEQGLVTLDRMLNASRSKDPEQHIVKGNALYKLKRHPEAQSVVKQALDMASDPKPEWLSLLLGIYLESGQAAEAAKLAEQISQKNPGDVQAQLNAATAYMEAGQADKAIALLEKLRANGQITEARDYRNLYALYSNAPGKEKEVIAVIDDGLAKGILKPDHDTYTALAQAYWFSEQPERAADAYRKAAPLAPDGEGYLNLAKVLHNSGKKADARQAAQQALDKGVKTPEEARRIIDAGPRVKAKGK